MAKKKKRTRAKKVEPAITEQSAFWPLAGAVVLCVAALLLLFGGFGTGGPLPRSLFHGDYWTFGWAAYLTPIALVFWGTYKFITEDRRIPLNKLISMLAVLLFASSWLFTAFATKQTGSTYTGGHGGMLGNGMGQAVLSVLDKFPASLVFLIFAVLAAFFAFGISPKVILKLGDIFKSKNEEDSDLTALKVNTESNFKLNEGVPVEHHSPRDQASSSSLKNTPE